MNEDTHIHSRLTALCPGLHGWAGTRKVKPIWISLKQETVSGSGISWAICKSAPRSRQITTPAPYHSVFYRPDALPAAQPTASNHWRQGINEWRHKFEEHSEGGWLITVADLAVGRQIEACSAAAGEAAVSVTARLLTPAVEPLTLINICMAISRTHQPQYLTTNRRGGSTEGD